MQPKRIHWFTAIAGILRILGLNHECCSQRLNNGRSAAALLPGLFALVFATSTLAQESDEGILFLHLRRDATGVTLLEAVAAPGRLKSGTRGESRGGALEFEIVRSDGVNVYEGQVADPMWERIEFPDANEAGVIRSEWWGRDSAEFTVRVPRRAAGKTVRFFQRRGEVEGELGALWNREPAGEFIIPENVGERERISALAVNARRHTLVTNGPTAARLNIAVLAEGFTAGEESSFTNRARSVVTQFLNTSPYQEYREHFNVFAIFVASAESGSDHPAQSISRDTYFSSSYGTGGLVRLITIPPNQWNPNYSAGRGKVFALLEEFVPEYDIALLLVNDSEYGGSGGVPAIGSIHASSVELALHEIGHSFAGLGDEYDSFTPGYSGAEKPNTTAETRRESVKWRNWINASTPVPTPETQAYANVIGLFEGAHFEKTGWYRPKLNCRMNSLGEEFCAVCKEAIVLSTYSAVGIFQGSSPRENNLTVPGGGELTLAVETVSSAAAPLTYTWTIDGVTNSALTADGFTASYGTLGVGSRLVRVVVADPTPLVRTDPQARLWKSRSWLVSVLSETNRPPVIGEIPSANFPALEGEAQFPWTVFDPDTSVEELSVSVQSNNTNLFAPTDLILSGNGTNRVLTLKLRCGVTGWANITIFASDGINTASETFEVTLMSNPAILLVAAIPDQAGFNESVTVPVPLSYSGCRESSLAMSASSSNPELLPDENVMAEGSGTNWVLRFTPIEGRSGSTLVTVFVTDGQVGATSSFDVTVLTVPQAVAAQPIVRADGVLLRFTVQPAASMILERSADLKFWTPVTSVSDAIEIEYLAPRATFEPNQFYRIRVVPL